MGMQALTKGLYLGALTGAVAVSYAWLRSQYDTGLDIAFSSVSLDVASQVKNPQSAEFGLAVLNKIGIADITGASALAIFLATIAVFLAGWIVWSYIPFLRVKGGTGKNVAVIVFLGTAVLATIMAGGFGIWTQWSYWAIMAIYALLVGLTSGLLAEKVFKLQIPTERLF